MHAKMTAAVAHPKATDLASAASLRKAIGEALRAHAADVSAHNDRAAVVATPLSTGGRFDVGIELERHVMDARVHVPGYGPTNPRPAHLRFSQGPAGASEAQIVAHANELRRAFNAHVSQVGRPTVDLITARRLRADEAHRAEILDDYAREGWTIIDRIERLRAKKDPNADELTKAHATQIAFARYHAPKEAA